MLGAQLSERARRVRHVTVSDALAITITATSGSYFPAKIVPPTQADNLEEASPREGKARSKLVYAGAQPLSVADRVEIYGGLTYELLTNPRPLRHASRVVGAEVEVLALGTLYPRTARIEKQGGEDVALNVPVSIFTPADARAERGDFEDTQAEAAIEWEDELQPKNRQLIVGTRRFKVAEAVTDFDVPHVKMRLRRA